MIDSREQGRHHLLRRAGRTLIATDPGWVRLRSATGVTLSAIVAMAASLLFVRIMNETVSMAGLGAVVGMFAPAFVTDPTRRARTVTTLLLFFPATAAVALAVALTQVGRVADAGFVVVLFCAMWMRRFGPRGIALGMIAYICYFFTLFNRTEVGEIPAFAAVIVIGLAATLLVRMVILPDRPAAALHRLMRAFRATTLTAMETASTPVQRNDATIRRQLDRLGETALMIEDWLGRNDAARSLDVDNDELSLRIFEAQVASEQLVLALWRLDPEQEWPDTVSQVSRAVALCLSANPTEDDRERAHRVVSEIADNADPATLTGVAELMARRVVAAFIAIHELAPVVARGEVREVPLATPPPEPPPDGMRPTTKAAIQVAVATSIATVLGDLVSPDRWYWAVLTAFVVFTGASTRGEILTRAGHRLVGTLVGVVAGVLLAALVGSHSGVQLAILVLCVFCAFYVAPVSYAALTFFVTVLLAMLYGLLGTFSVEVLEVRIAETAVGAAVGVASAFFVLSTSTRAKFVADVRTYLDELNDVIDSSVGAVVTPGDSADLIARTRGLDTALAAARASGKPLELGPTTRIRHSVRRLLQVLQSGNRRAHALARTGVVAAAHGDAEPIDSETATALRHAAAMVHDTVEAVAATVAGDRSPRSTPNDDDVMSVLQTAPTGPPIARSAIRALSMLEGSLTQVLRS